MNKRFLLLSSALLLLVNCKNEMKIKTKDYPSAPKDTTIVDNYFGTMVKDEYRPLEDDNAPETVAWVKAENEVTNDYLSRIPYRNALKKRLTALYDYPKYGIPERHGDNLLFFKNDGLQNQSVLYIQNGKEETPGVLLDPNTFSEDGTVALVTVSVSKDNRYLAYSVAESGSDWVEIRVMDMESRKVLADTIRWVKFSGAEWSEGGFYYSRYDEPEKGKERTNTNEYQKVYYHKLGTSQADDKLIFEDKQHPLRYFSPVVGDDDEYLFVVASEGTSGTQIYYKKRKSDAPFKILYEGFASDYTPVWCKNGKLLALTNNGAPNGRLIESALGGAEPVTRDLIPEGENLLESVSVAGGKIFASYLQDACTKVWEYTLEGDAVREIAFPALGAAAGFSGGDNDTEIYYSFSSFNYPPTVYEYDVVAGSSVPVFQGEAAFSPDDFVVEQLFFESKDGTKVPMFLNYKKGMQRNGNNPVHIYGYGGFNINMPPSFSPANILFMEQGGIYVSVNLRGGGEYGEEWHKAGMLENKQNVFDDFIAAAEYLVKEKYTNPDKIAVSGGSNGGLLVGACMTQRPDLYAVAFPRVGVLDMLRYHKFTVGWGWAVEYGSSDNQEQFDYLIKYSPLHNIRKGTCYPATMVMTADHDDRVVPAHSFKFGATLQQAQGCDKPVLIRIDSNAGHGAGKPTGKAIDEMTDMYAFMFYNLGVTPKIGQ